MRATTILVFAFVSMSTPLLAIGCVGADATTMVRVQAAKDFVCAESTVRVERKLDGSYVALGCGKHGSYRALCEGVRCAISKNGEAFNSPQQRTFSPEPGNTNR